MGDLDGQADWYYVGHYGQLGPLTLDQMIELAQDGVISPETYVWKAGMADWIPAQSSSELRSLVMPMAPEFLPPPPPGSPERQEVRPPTAPAMPVQQQYAPLNYGNWSLAPGSVPKSDKSRVTAGLLNLLPGIGRFYMGYSAHGVLQLFTAFFCGVGFIWSIVDGIYILMGGVKYDGYGRTLQD